MLLFKCINHSALKPKEFGTNFLKQIMDWLKNWVLTSTLISFVVFTFTTAAYTELLLAIYLSELIQYLFYNFHTFKKITKIPKHSDIQGSTFLLFYAGNCCDGHNAKCTNFLYVVNQVWSTKWLRRIENACIKTLLH
jgi:hypothetical protein